MVKHQKSKSHRLKKWLLGFCLFLAAIIISANIANNTAYIVCGLDSVNMPVIGTPTPTVTLATVVFVSPTAAPTVALTIAPFAMLAPTPVPSPVPSLTPTSAPTPAIATAKSPPASVTPKPIRATPTPAPAAKNPTGTVAVNELNMRSGPDTVFKIVKCLVKEDRLEILEQNGDWYMVTTLDGKTGWVYKSYVSLDKPDIQIKSSRSGSRTSELIEYAKRFLGVKYSWSGITPDGFDCSGFTSYIFRKFQIVLPHSSALQAKGGLPVARADLRCGDLVFFDTNGGLDKINHVGIYMGDGRFIHASSSHKKVIISDMKSYSIGAYITARRYLD